MNVELREELDAAIAELPEENLRALVKLLRRLGPNRPLRRWSPDIGGLSDADAEEMRRIIEEEFENVEPDAW